MHNPASTSTPGLQVNHNHNQGPKHGAPSKVWSPFSKVRPLGIYLAGILTPIVAQALLLGSPSFNSIEVWERVEDHWSSAGTEESYKESYDNFFSEKYVAQHPESNRANSYSYWRGIKQSKYTAKEASPDHSQIYLVTQHQYSKNPQTEVNVENQRYALDCLSWIAKIPTVNCPKSYIRVDSIVKQKGQN